MASLTSLSFHIFAHYHGSNAFRQIRRDMREVNDQFHKSVRRSAELSRSLHLVRSAALVLAPALIPIGAHLLAIGAGFAAASVAAGAAAGIFGLALKGAISRALTAKQSFGALRGELDKQKQILALMTPGTAHYEKQLKKVAKAQDMYNHALKKVAGPQRQFIGAMDNMKSKWGEFIDKTQADTLKPASTVINAIANSLVKLVPVVHAVAPIANEVANAFKRWTTNGGLDRFLNLLIKYGVPALRSFKNMVNNVLTVLGIGFRAFLPTGMTVVHALERGSKALAGWAEGGGFKRFLEYVNKNSPEVKEFFKTLGKALKKVSEAMVNVAPLSLMLATALLRIVAAMPTSWLEKMIQLWVLWKAVVLGMLIIEKLKIAFYAFRKAVIAVRAAMFLLNAAFLASPLGWIVLAIGLVVAAFVLLWLKCKGFRDFWKKVWHGIQAVAAAVWGWLKHNWKLLLTVFLLALGPAGWFFAALLNWRKVWNGMKHVAKVVWHFIRDKVLGPIGNFFTKKIPDAAGTFKRAIVGAFQWVKDKVKGIWDWIKRNIIDKILGAFRKVKEGLDKINPIKQGKNLLKKIPLIGGLFASGGPVMGPGTGTSDSIMARLSNGEHVWTAKEVSAFGGHSAMTQLRRAVVGRVQGFAAGGPVGATGTAGGGPVAPVAPTQSGVTQAKANTQDAITGIIMPVVALFEKTVPQASATMTTQVGQKWAQLKSSVAQSVGSVSASVGGGWKKMGSDVAVQMSAMSSKAGQVSASWRQMGANTGAQFRGMTNTAKASSQAIGASWVRTRGQVTGAAAGMARAAFTPMNAWQRTALPQAAASMKNRVNAAWGQTRNGVINFQRGMARAAFTPMNAWQRSVLPASAVFMRNRVNTAWSQTRSGISALHRGLTSSVYRPIQVMYTRSVPGWAGSMKTGVTRAFGNMRDGVRTTWKGIQNATKDPVNWVISNTYGRGIRSLWNAVSKVIFGAGKRQLPPVKRLAAGGPVRGPGGPTGDRVPAMLSAGEHVWTAREVRAAGGHKGMAAMRSYAVGGGKVRMFGGTGHFAEGGALGGGLSRGSLLPWIGSRMDPVKANLDRTLGKSVAFRDMVRTAMQKKILDILDFVAKDDAANMPVAGGFTPFRPWKAGDGRHVGFRGVTLNARSRDMMLKAEGLAKKRFQYFQGSWSHAAASAGTHSGGGAVDIGPAQDPNVGFMRASGWAAWRRTPAEGFSPHIHGIAVGDPTVSPGAAAQVRAFFNGRNGLANNGPDTFLGGVGAGGAKAYARSYMKVMGWPDKMWPALAALWQRESGWNYKAKNPSSGAYGIPQSLPASKMGSEGRDWRTNPAKQIRWGEKYIKGRYGNPVTANNWQRSHNWYAQGGGVLPMNSFDRGGMLPKGLSLAYNGTGSPEPVGHEVGGDVHFHGPVYVKSEREFREMVIEAYADAKRRNRV